MCMYGTGGSNPIVRIGVLDIRVPTLVPTWMNLSGMFEDGDKEYYVCRVGWWAWGWVQALVQDRSQTHIQLLALHPLTGTYLPTYLPTHTESVCSIALYA